MKSSVRNGATNWTTFTASNQTNPTREKMNSLEKQKKIQRGPIPNRQTHSCWFEKRKVAQLLVREAESREYKDDETGLLRWRISMWPYVVVARGHKYDRQAVLIPESDIHDHNSQIYDEPETCVDDFDYWGERLYLCQSLNW
ncbi:hypothetical protein GMDG_01723 [Pseudogymnoascus destructans 20631-21]|uniref:Uncharacterized protein n=1 Tax=Pseudogymnoascus destructans (strain ATCC MYA-4855 / 20631-21) TaxID=658429 RepID=L8FY59_PSED2|nr:hypothetical protein GMDG_01723 [Pseudogymnoascus destructans 20631-21]